MFTGIIEHQGHLMQEEALSEGLRWWVEPKPFFQRAYRRGESIAVNGVCLTITDWNGPVFSVEISPETLRCTTLGSQKTGRIFHLERALCMGDSLGGHFVLGHVDCVGEVVKWEKGREFATLSLKLAPEAKPYLAPKGSLAVDGVSLTINHVQHYVSGPVVEMMLVPHTLSQTRLGDNVEKGRLMNIEYDVIARYIAHAVKPYEFH